jgi:proteic killer suppression protein
VQTRDALVSATLVRHEARMLINFEDRSSDSPFVERVWRSHSERAGKDTWSVWVNGNWRVTFSFEGKDAIDVDYKDYH